MLEKRVAQKIRNGQSISVAAVPDIMYYILWTTM
jgi:hypothetical protein